jgi:hypothetical protein
MLTEERLDRSYSSFDNPDIQFFFCARHSVVTAPESVQGNEGEQASEYVLDGSARRSLNFAKIFPN